MPKLELYTRIKVNLPFSAFHGLTGTVVKVITVKWDQDTIALIPHQLPNTMYVVDIDNYGSINKQSGFPIAYSGDQLSILPPKYAPPVLSSWSEFNRVMRGLGEDTLANTIKG